MSCPRPRNGTLWTRGTLSQPFELVLRPLKIKSQSERKSTCNFLQLVSLCDFVNEKKNAFRCLFPGKVPFTKMSQELVSSKESKAKRRVVRRRNGRLYGRREVCRGRLRSVFLLCLVLVIETCIGGAWTRRGSTGGKSGVTRLDSVPQWVEIFFRPFTFTSPRKREKKLELWGTYGTRSTLFDIKKE